MTQQKHNSNKEMVFQSQDQVYVFVESTNTNTYHIHIDGEIGEPEYYRSLQGILGNCSELDTVVFHLNSPGGQVDTALSMYHWVKQTDATTIAVLEGTAASAATFFLMGCDSVIAMPHSCAMVHSACFGTIDKHKQVRDYVDFMDKRLKNLYTDLYRGFLTEKEISNIVDNSEEMWFDAEQVIDRLNAREDNLDENGQPRAILIEEVADESYLEIEEIVEGLIEEKQSKKPTKKSSKNPVKKPRGLV